MRDCSEVGEVGKRETGQCHFTPVSEPPGCLLHPNSKMPSLGCVWASSHAPCFDSFVGLHLNSPDASRMDGSVPAEGAFTPPALHGPLPLPDGRVGKICDDRTQSKGSSQF